MIDDLSKHGNLSPNITRLGVENKILQTLRKHNISHVYGFLNGEHFPIYLFDQQAACLKLLAQGIY